MGLVGVCPGLPLVNDQVVFIKRKQLTGPMGVSGVGHGLPLAKDQGGSSVDHPLANKSADGSSCLPISSQILVSIKMDPDNWGTFPRKRGSWQTDYSLRTFRLRERKCLLGETHPTNHPPSKHVCKPPSWAK